MPSLDLVVGAHREQRAETALRCVRVPNSGMFGTPFGVTSARTMSSAPTCRHHRGEQVGPLGHRAADQDAAGAAAQDAELGRRGVALRDQVLGAGDEVLPGVRLGRLEAGLVPVLAVDAAAARIGHREHAAGVEPGEPAGAEERLLGDAVARVAVQQRRVAAVERDALLVDDRHRHQRAVVARHLAPRWPRRRPARRSGPRGCRPVLLDPAVGVDARRSGAPGSSSAGRAAARAGAGRPRRRRPRRRRAWNEPCHRQLHLGERRARSRRTARLYRRLTLPSRASTYSASAADAIAGDTRSPWPTSGLASADDRPRRRSSVSTLKRGAPACDSRYSVSSR